MMEAEIRRWRKGPQAKQYRQPLEAEKTRKLTLLRASRKNQPCLHLHFRPVKLISDL